MLNLNNKRKYDVFGFAVGILSFKNEQAADCSVIEKLIDLLDDTGKKMIMDYIQEAD